MSTRKPLPDALNDLLGELWTINIEFYGGAADAVRRSHELVYLVAPSSVSYPAIAREDFPSVCSTRIHLIVAGAQPPR